ncbi:MAG: type II toxin-antitoxin system RelE/ParE family toxin [Burkholderiales bacterium]
MSRARFLPSAETEFLAEIAFYASAGQGIGVRFQAAVELTLTTALEHPYSGVPGRRSTRHLPIKGFPFFLVYRLDGDELLVVALAHQSRRPDYWRTRLK